MLPLRPRTPVLVEGCAGMAAVSWAAFGMTPPVSYQGGKRGYAADILRHLRIWRPERIVLVETDPWVAAALRCAWSAPDRARAVAICRESAEPEERQRARWNALREAMQAGRLAPDSPDAGAIWLWMRPRTVPFVQPHEARASDWMPRAHPRDGSSQWAIGAPATSLARPLPPCRVEVRCASIADQAPIPGAILYLDPPYQGTTGYADGATLTRAEVLAAAGRWRDAGCAVGVSEAEPLSGHARALTKRGRVRSFGSTAEHLSIWSPA